MLISFLFYLGKSFLVLPPKLWYYGSRKCERPAPAVRGPLPGRKEEFYVKRFTWPDKKARSSAARLYSRALWAAAASHVLYLALFL